MAEVGYDEDFISDPPDDLVCLICQFIAKDPVRIENCGHGMCKACFAKLMGNAERR